MVEGVKAFPSAYVYAIEGSKRADGMVSIFAFASLPIIFPLTLGFLLFTFPGRLANQFFELPVDASNDRRAYQNLLSIAIIILGLYLLTGSIIDASWWWGKLGIFSLIFDRDGMKSGIWIQPDQFASIFASLFQFLLGVFLTFKS